MDLDHLSFATTPIVALYEQEPVWQGSGFFYLYKRGDSQFLYLVTNYHVLSGQAPGKAAHYGADEIVFQFHLDADEPGKVRPVRVPLFSSKRRPVWLQSERSPEADLAVVPITPNVCSGCKINCLDAGWIPTDVSGLSPLAPMHVVGFPYGYHDRENALPLWQAGTLASEPSVDSDGYPMLTIDMPAYPGMSGAPAFALGYRQESGSGQSQASTRMVRQFLGVYASLPITDDGAFPEAFCTAGRPGVIARDAGTWGRVWRASLLEELVSSVDTERWEREILADLVTAGTTR